VALGSFRVRFAPPIGTRSAAAYEPRRGVRQFVHYRSGRRQTEAERRRIASGRVTPFRSPFWLRLVECRRRRPAPPAGDPRARLLQIRGRRSRMLPREAAVRCAHISRQ
jgi:hypothetical protein